jgi:hypothetical protein
MRYLRIINLFIINHRPLGPLYLLQSSEYLAPAPVTDADISKAIDTLKTYNSVGIAVVPIFLKLSAFLFIVLGTYITQALPNNTSLLYGRKWLIYPYLQRAVSLGSVVSTTTGYGLGDRVVGVREF